MYTTEYFNKTPHIEDRDEELPTFERTPDSISAIVVIYISVSLTALAMSFLIYCIKMTHIGQKTHSPQRRMYVGRNAATPTAMPEPTIFVSPANLPPPPKYELMAPPSYDEVVGMQYPYTNSPNQPISQPIAFAVALQNSDVAPVHSLPSFHTANETSPQNTGTQNNANNNNEAVTVSNDTRPATAPVISS